MKWKLLTSALSMSVFCSTPVLALDQKQIDLLGSQVFLHYVVLDNTQDAANTFRAKISLSNQGNTPLPQNDWTIWFSHIRSIPTVYNSQFAITHVNGDIFKLEPTSKFKGLGVY